VIATRNGPRIGARARGDHAIAPAMLATLSFVRGEAAEVLVASIWRPFSHDRA
jgi:hypothetical protein